VQDWTLAGGEPRAIRTDDPRRRLDMIAAIDLGDLLVTLLVLYLIVMYVVIVVTVIFDVLRSRDLSGGKKALWVIAMMLVPIITMIVYLFSRGDGLGMRNLEDERRYAPLPAPDPDTAVLPAASPTDELERAKRLLDDGAISADEYAALKQRILS
jgi:Phospholipase_D-nuclease N-terminal/Short C-terminal domain